MLTILHVYGAVTEKIGGEAYDDEVDLIMYSESGYFL